MSRARKTGTSRCSTYWSKVSVLIAPSIIIGAQTPRRPRAAIAETFGPRWKGPTVFARRPFCARARGASSHLAGEFVNEDQGPDLFSNVGTLNTNRQSEDCL